MLMFTVWFKQGVVGDLLPTAQKGFGRVARMYTKREDMYVTCIRDGNHMHGSFHYIGLAWDMRKGSFSKRDIKKALGKGFDVVEHSTHYHIEYDPK